MKHLVLLCWLSLLMSASAFAGTYTVQAVTVTHSGGWPSYSSGPGSTVFGYSSDGGEVSGSPHHDGFYNLNSALTMQSFASVSSLTPKTFTLDRDNITVTFTLHFTEGYSGETPGAATGLADTRYTLTAVGQVSETVGSVYTASSAGYEIPPSTATYTWRDCIVSFSGINTVFNFYPAANSWQFYKTESVTFGSWTQVSPGEWECTGNVPYDASTWEYDLKMLSYGASGARRTSASTYGEWQYRLKEVIVGGSTVFSQTGF